ncbi:DUF167 domain-containing protein [Candidatus Bathyarchaeota archaeon]|nr:DUF167 domain-containing protein [Candidatus Bathyarchaeota archaeon]
MKLLETSRGVIFDVFVKPCANVFQIKIDDNKLVVWCHEAPRKGKVNKELLKKFSQIFGRKVELISGFTSTQKKLLVNDINSKEVNRILDSI